ncbi:substrate-binding domain-containing protein [Nocardioides sp. zg-DK7169]|uniref:substrate-binding domain-containing protein n=1 Tax=Nocardioides sp. zg-DK7169 TaxID=2736600 RepID=UPI0015535E03|nr:substrate-binding domain-containing protein [Nocardioides sp. zg-DK7169]NPC98478.1 hypothetical protein [Nocardioides sp. zg-DK7169]
MTRRRSAGLALALVLGAALSACSSDDAPSDDLVTRAQEDQQRQQVADEQRLAERQAELPGLAPGTVVVDGATTGSLTPAVSRDWAGSGTPVRVEVRRNGEDRAFADLCAGRIDVADSARGISAAEWEACRAVGLELVEIQVAADAVVVAIKSETDVGGDCLSTVQVQDAYRAGSPITSWSQLGLNDIPLTTGGPDPDNNAFGFFGRHVLDAPQPALVNYRSDYVAHDSDEESRVFVVGDEADERVAGRAGDWQRRSDDVRSTVAMRRQVVADAQVEVDIAGAEVDKGVRDKRPASQQQADRARLDRARAALSAARADLRRAQALSQRVRARTGATVAAQQRVAATLGHTAYFRFSYYELFEDQLRPFEITGPDGQRNCVFASQRTIVSGEYPLSRRLLLTTTTRSLEREEVHTYLEHYLQQAPSLAEAARLVPLPEDQVNAELAIVRGETAPTPLTPDGVEEPGTGPSDQPAL